MTERRIGWRDWTLVLVTLAIWLAMLAVCVMDVQRAEGQVTIPGAAKGQVKVPLHAHTDIGNGGKIKFRDLDFSSVESGSAAGGCTLPCLNDDNAWTGINTFTQSITITEGGLSALGTITSESFGAFVGVPADYIALYLSKNGTNGQMIFNVDDLTDERNLSFRDADYGYLMGTSLAQTMSGHNLFTVGTYLTDTLSVAAPALITGVFNATGIKQFANGTYFTDSVSVAPATDVLPLRVTQHSGATADLTVWEASDGTDMAKVDAAGTGHFGEFTGGTGLPLVLYNGDLTTTAKAKFDLSALTGTRTYTWPDVSGSVVFGGNSATITGNLSTTLAASTSSNGAAFQDNTTSSKKLRVITSGSSASTNNAISFTTASSRTFAFTDQVTPTVVLKTGTDVNLANQTGAIGSTALYTPVAAGMYRVSWYARTTTADAGEVDQYTPRIIYTDAVGSTTRALCAALDVVTTTMTPAANGGSSGVMVIYVASGTINYDVTISGSLGATAQYELRLRVEAI